MYIANINTLVKSTHEYYHIPEFCCLIVIIIWIHDNTSFNSNYTRWNESYSEKLI